MARKPKSKPLVPETAKQLLDALTDNQIPQPEPGNETKLGRKNGRMKIQELPAMRGKGVELVTYPDLDKMGDELDDLREKKSKLAEKITATEAMALKKMADLGISKYRFNDRVMEVAEGKDHVRVKMVQTGDDSEDADE